MSVATETEEKLWYTTEELAKRWLVHRRTVAREVTRGRLKESRIGERIRFSKEEVERYERLA